MVNNDHLLYILILMYFMQRERLHHTYEYLLMDATAVATVHLANERYAIPMRSMT